MIIVLLNSSLSLSHFWKPRISKRVSLTEISIRLKTNGDGRSATLKWVNWMQAQKFTRLLSLLNHARLHIPLFSFSLSLHKIAASRIIIIVKVTDCVMPPVFSYKFLTQRKPIYIKYMYMHTLLLGDFWKNWLEIYFIKKICRESYAKQAWKQFIS